MSRNVTKRLELERVKRRSRLYQWLYARHGELAPICNGVRPPWGALVETIRADPEWTRAVPSRQSVFYTWKRVDRDKAASGGEVAVVKPVAPPESTPVVRKARAAGQTTEEILKMMSPGSRLPEPINPKKE